MILTKNKLKKIEFKDDDMLNYLKYSHLEPIREDNILKVETSDKATQFPDIMNNFTQTDKKVMVDKETDTYDELNTIDPPYYLTSTLKNFKSKEPSRADKMAQVWSTTVEKKTPPSSNNGSDGSEDPSGRSRDNEGSMSRNLDRGLRMAQMTGSAMLTALNLADTVGSAVLSPVIDSALDLLMSNPPNENEEEEVEEVEEVPTGSADVPQVMARDRSRSRDDSEDNDLGNRLLRRGASRSRSSSPASSAKTTPKKK